MCAIFARQIGEIRSGEQNRLVSVDSFEKDYVNLANEINLYVEKEQKAIRQAEHDRQQLKMTVAGKVEDREILSFKTLLENVTLGQYDWITGYLSGRI